MSAELGRTYDVQELATLLGRSTAFVYAHCKTRDPEQYWEHLRVGAGIRAAIRFTAAQVDAVLAKCLNAGPAPESAQVDDADLERGLRRLLAS